MPDNIVTDKTFSVQEVTKAPTFQGEDGRNFRRWVYQQFILPTEVENVEGKLACSFVVDTTGKVINVRIREGLHPLVDEEVIRLISNSPEWTPGEIDGKKVRVRYTMPMDFSILTAKDVEVKPTFQGKDDNHFTEWVFKNMTYPEVAKRNRIQGRVIVEFVVTAEGDVTNVKVLRGVHPSLDEEAVRVISMSPKWSPGIQHYRPVRVKYVFPVIFGLR